MYIWHMQEQRKLMRYRMHSAFQNLFTTRYPTLQCNALITSANGDNLSNMKNYFYKRKLKNVRFHRKCSEIFFYMERIEHLPNILLRSALCRSGFSSANFLRSTLAHTMNAFIGRRMRASFALFIAFAAAILLFAPPAPGPPPPPPPFPYDWRGNIP